MVATAGRGWRLAPCLVDCVNEADMIAPRRSNRSDGSIGDRSHRNRNSDHNVSGGYVHAVDLTHDPAHGWDAHARARELASRTDLRVKYIISNRMIWSRWRGWRRYSGSNPHTLHAHISVHSYARWTRGAWWLKGKVAKIPPAIEPPEVKPTPTSKDKRKREEKMKFVRVENGPKIYSWVGHTLKHIGTPKALNEMQNIEKVFGASESEVKVFSISKETYNSLKKI